jgi:septum formation protein
MLADARVPATVRPAGIDDADVVRGAVGPRQWVMALAWMKARWVAGHLRAEGRHGTVLGADTLCVLGDRLLGKPDDRASARVMLDALRNTTHETMTGVCLLDVDGGERELFVESTIVTWGDISDETLDRYVESDAWRGKAGAYNLAERVEAGWPITCVGDPTTVMGLPMRRLSPWLETLGETRS